MRFLALFLIWCILFVLSWPIALALLLVLMMAAAVMASTVSFALALSHHALEILVGHHPPLG